MGTGKGATVILSPLVPWVSKPESARSGPWAGSSPPVGLRFVYCTFMPQRRSWVAVTTECGVWNLQHVLPGPLQRKPTDLCTERLRTSVLCSTHGWAAWQRWSPKCSPGTIWKAALLNIWTNQVKTEKPYRIVRSARPVQPGVTWSDRIN